MRERERVLSDGVEIASWFLELITEMPRCWGSNCLQIYDFYRGRERERGAEGKEEQKEKILIADMNVKIGSWDWDPKSQTQRRKLLFDTALGSGSSSFFFVTKNYTI